MQHHKAICIDSKSFLCGSLRKAALDQSKRLRLAKRAAGHMVLVLCAMPQLLATPGLHLAEVQSEEPAAAR
jgi:hypothetical protein